MDLRGDGESEMKWYWIPPWAKYEAIHPGAVIRTELVGCQKWN